MPTSTSISPVRFRDAAPWGAGLPRARLRRESSAWRGERLVGGAAREAQAPAEGGRARARRDRVQSRAAARDQRERRGVDGVSVRGQRVPGRRAARARCRGDWRGAVIGECCEVADKRESTYAMTTKVQPPRVRSAGGLARPPGRRMARGNEIVRITCAMTTKVRPPRVWSAGGGLARHFDRRVSRGPGSARSRMR